MNKKKNILLIILIITLIISINTINAQTTDNNKTTIKTNTQQPTINNTQEKKIEHNKEKINIKKQNNNIQKKKTIKTNEKDETNTIIQNITTYKELENKINNAKTSNATHYIINMKKGNYNITKQIQWTTTNQNMKSLTINGQNSTINGQNKQTFIKINSETPIHLTNMIITNTTGKYGSAIYNNGYLTINNITISNSKATNTKMLGGGAITNIGNLEITNTHFENNTAFSGGAIYNLKDNLTNKGQLTIKDSTFTNNNADSGSCIYSLQDSGLEVINSTFINNTSNSSIISTKQSNYTLNITNSLFKNNNAENLITNPKNLIINYTTITNNTIETIINNENNLLLNNSIISYNNIQKQGIYSYNSNALIINNTFRNNIIEEKSLIFSDISNTTVISSKFYNNTAINLFDSTENIFKLVKNNEYIGNNLKNTTLIVNSKNSIKNPMNISIFGIVETNPIYNTTITTGEIRIINANNTIALSNIINGTFNTTILLNKTGKNTISVIYNGDNNFISTQIDYDIQIDAPTYSLDIIPKNNTYTYGDMIKYTIALKNTNNVKGYDIEVKNIIPDNLKYINCSSLNYNPNTNIWYVKELNSNETIAIDVTTQSLNNENIFININTTNTINQNVTTKNYTIIYLEPTYLLNISQINKTYVYGNNMTFNINLKNIGKVKGSNITVTYILKNNNTILNYKQETITHINPNETKEICYNEVIKNSGITIGTIEIKDVCNVTCFETFNFSVSTPSIHLYNITAQYGDTITLRAKLENITYLSTDTILFKINGKTIQNHTINITNNTLLLLNLKLNDTFKKPYYLLKIIYYQEATNTIIQDNATLLLNKIKVRSYVNNITALPGEYINLTVKLVDEYNHGIDSGKVIFKINRKTLRDDEGNIIYLKVYNSTAQLNNFKIPLSFNNKNYSLDMVYGGSYIYMQNRNSSILTLKKQDVKINIKPVLHPTEGLIINTQLKANQTNETINGGNIILKINGKTLSNKIAVSKENIQFTYASIKNIEYIKNITICYSGTPVYNPTKYTIYFNNVTSIKNNLKTQDLSLTTRKITKEDRIREYIKKFITIYENYVVFPYSFFK